jgi:glycosyltransferase involved in cell wall biosynthesis
MKIAIDLSPLSTGHKVRGSGFYLTHLKRALLRNYPDNSYLFFETKKNEPRQADLTHYPYFDPFSLTLPLHKKHKTIITVHDLIPLVFPKYFPTGIKGSIVWQMQKAALKNCNAVITDSISSRNDIAKLTGIDNELIYVIYLAAGEEFRKVEKVRFQPEADPSMAERVESLKKRYNLPEKFVLYVGDATWNKNLPRLVEAVKKVNVPLVMVGEAITRDNVDNNPWNDDLIRIQKQITADNRFLCLGFIPNVDLVMLYNTASVLVMPSLYEGFGLPVLEAMSCACPVITSRKGSLVEVCGDTVLYIDPYNIDSIAKGIEDVYFNNELQKDLSENGFQHAKLFSWKKTAEQTINVYEKVFRNKNL